jgi:hypothetical protein
MNLSLRPSNILGHLPSTLWAALAASLTTLATNFTGLPAPWPTIGIVVSGIAFVLGALAGPAQAKLAVGVNPQ